jgi:citrate synthase
VSRGFIRSRTSSGSTRERAYARDDVERLRRQTEERRAPDKAAARALQWGMPILESSIALIDGQRLYYRGHDAAELARTHALEDVAALIWTGRNQELPETPSMAVSEAPRTRHATFVARAQTQLALASSRDAQAMDLRPATVARTGSLIVKLVTHAVTGVPVRAATHLALAQHWRVGARGVDIVRAALVLLADHELNVSSFTARCVASSGSHLYAVVIAGLAALEGPKHGGAGVRVESMLDAMRRTRPLKAALRDRRRRGATLEGVGQPHEPDGDPRARLLLDLLADRYSSSAEWRFVREFLAAARSSSGEEPNIDFALAATARVLKLPPGAPLMLFAIGRTVGWIGHALEQYATGQLIRPRARYVGAPPR